MECLALGMLGGWCLSNGMALLTDLGFADTDHAVLMFQFFEINIDQLFLNTLNFLLKYSWYEDSSWKQVLNCRIGSCFY